MSSKVLALLLSAAAVAGAVSFFVVPKLEDRAEPPKAESVNIIEEADIEPSMRRSAVMLVRNDGHYWARSLVNRKASVDFMVDTGASTVAVTQKDARKMGFRPDELEYNSRIRTAGGITYGADIVIDSIKVGQVEVKNVHAIVMKEELTQSLLGMSFLRELYSYEFRSDRLIIRQ
tara:strand:+ start:132 stop:656 length:525 start_codon:yes stop_codon:yes gene_type:complete